MNIYKNLIFAKEEEQQLEIFSAADYGLRVERILSSGQSSDWYDQEEGELVFLLQGEAELEFADGGKRVLRRGDGLWLEAHVKHRVSATSQHCVWLCIFAEKR